MTKVSVIIATYRPGDGLDRVLGSLDAQTMPADDIEIVCVDDGSGDTTADRLRAEALARPNLQVHEIENSGWPSRPRNVGLGHASGEYVTFMDHDDSLYPDGLRAAYDFAVRHRLDVVNTKESTTSGRFWGFSHLQEDVVAEGRVDPTLLMPMRPHKLYRRELLERHAIRFREGRRVIYEDIYFNLDVLPHAHRVGVLASVPFYLWHSTGENNSGSYGEDPDEAWHAFESIFEQIAELAVPSDVREALVLHTYRLRVLTMMLGTRLSRMDETWRRRSLELAPALADRFVPAYVDEQLDPAARVRAHLLRSGRTELLPVLADLDRGVNAVLEVSSATWTPDGRLRIEGTAPWRDREGEPLPVAPATGAGAGAGAGGVEADSPALVRVLPPELAGVVPEELRRLDEALSASEATLTVKSRRDSTDWALDTSHRLSLRPGAVPVLAAEVSADADLAEAVFGSPLPDGEWSVGCRLTFAGFTSHTPVRYSGPPSVALVDGRVVRAAASGNDRLVLHVGAGLDVLLRHTAPLVEAATVRRQGRRARLVLPLTGVAVGRDTRLPVVLQLRRYGGDEVLEAPAAVVADAAGSRLEATIALPVGDYRLTLVGDGTEKPWWSPFVLSRRRLGAVRLTRRPLRRRRKRVWGGDRASNPPIRVVDPRR